MDYMHHKDRPVKKDADGNDMWVKWKTCFIYSLFIELSICMFKTVKHAWNFNVAWNDHTKATLNILRRSNSKTNTY